METVWRLFTLTYSCTDCLRTETRKTTFQHSSFSKPAELPGALSQNRGLEHKASPLPAVELMLEVTRLQALKLTGRHQRNMLVFTSWTSRQSREDHFSSLVLRFCRISMIFVLPGLPVLSSGSLTNFNSSAPPTAAQLNCCCFSSKTKVKITLLKV